MNIGEIIYTDQEYQWHDTNTNGEFHIVEKMTAFKITGLTNGGDDNYIRIHNIKEKYSVLMLKEQYKDFFNNKIIRKQKLEKLNEKSNL